MIKIKSSIEIEEKANGKPIAATEFIEARPQSLKAIVYKIKSGFVNQSIYVTLSYLNVNGVRRPLEIFINSKDLSKTAEYAVLSRLISAIFRRAANPTFIIEELESIFDPNGGYHKDGKYIQSLYAEIASTISRFLIDVGLIESKAPVPAKETADNLGICPVCQKRSLKNEGCPTCTNPECLYSKCD